MDIRRNERSEIMYQKERIMKRICAWHAQNFGRTLTMEDGTDPATHGICADCADIEMGKVNTQRLDSNAQFGEPFNVGAVPLNLDPVAEGLDTSPTRVGTWREALDNVADMLTDT